MRIAIVGAGPAGLYFAYLMMRHRLAAEVLVYERNPRNATYGFGVVFSDRAFEFLREGDPELAATLQQHMASWDDLTIVQHDQAVPIDGNGFAAISRLQLLGALIERCEQNGVELRFDQALADSSTLAPYDLLVGADGAGSLLRDSAGARFAPTTERLSNFFIWYGTRCPFDTLTLTFRANEHGAFVAHHYRYRPDLSTFIVECDAEAWHKAGFAALSAAAARSYCERLFAADLQGHPLISNQSIWRNFAVITNQRWWRGKTVLIGDALRTVHFSIGSGTRLAMEDALALYRAFAATHSNGNGNGDIESALRLFEQQRRPIVEKLLAAAQGSYRWYEQLPRLLRMQPYALAYDYMTRSGRVGDQRLRTIAPRFMAAYESRVGR